MQITLEDQTPVRGDFVLRAVQRFDLAPIPSTLELTLRADSSLGKRIGDGTMLLAGSQLDRYRVLKVRRMPSQLVQGPAEPAEALEVTAVLEAFAPLAWPLARAVVKEGKSLGEVYRSCGALVRVLADVPMTLFACLAGQFPTPCIAQVMQEEAIAPVWRGAGKGGAGVSFVRLADLFTTRPVEAFAADTSRAVESQFLERQEIPAALSTAPDGSVLLGRRDKPRGFVFLPRSSARVLDNMTRCLVVRRTMQGTFAGHLRAGDGVDVAGVRHVIATVAHTWSGGGGGGAEQTSLLWLAQLQR